MRHAFQEHKFFDSADWALAQEGKHGQSGHAPVSDATLAAAEAAAAEQQQLPLPTPLTAHPTPVARRGVATASSGLRPSLH